MPKSPEEAIRATDRDDMIRLTWSIAGPGHVTARRRRIRGTRGDMPTGPGDVIRITEGGKIWVSMLVAFGVLVALIWGFLTTKAVPF